jgi:hypothetical protein
MQLKEERKPDFKFLHLSATPVQDSFTIAIQIKVHNTFEGFGFSSLIFYNAMMLKSL